MIGHSPPSDVPAPQAPTNRWSEATQAEISNEPPTTICLNHSASLNFKNTCTADCPPSSEAEVFAAMNVLPIDSQDYMSEPNVISASECLMATSGASDNDDVLDPRNCMLSVEPSEEKLPDLSGPLDVDDDVIIHSHLRPSISPSPKERRTFSAVVGESISVEEVREQVILDEFGLRPCTLNLTCFGYHLQSRKQILIFLERARLKPKVLDLKR